MRQLGIKVWANLIKKLAPKWCVMKGMLRTRQSAFYYQLGERKELYYVKRLELTDEQLEARLWSDGTVKTLLSEGRHCFRLISKMHHLTAVPVRNRVKALREFWSRNVPSHEYIKKFVQEENLCVLQEFFNKHNSSMEFLTLRDIVEVNASEQWEKAKALAKLNAIIADKFAQEVTLSDNAIINMAREERMVQFLSLAVLGGANISYACSELYKRNLWAEFLTEQLKQQKTTSIERWLRCMRRDAKNARSAMMLAKKYLDWSVYRQIVQANIKLLGEISKELAEELVEYVDIEPDNIAKVWPFASNWKRQKMLQGLLEEVGKADDKGQLLPYFPFDPLTADERRCAFLALINARKFPQEQISCLSKGDKEFVVEKLEEAAQIRMLSAEKLADLLKQPLYPKSELLFFEMEDQIGKQTAYINHFNIREAVFTKLLSLKGRQSLIEAKATKWGLSEEQYLQLLQSSYSYLALELKKTVKY